ncbi:hypothetical protein BDN70DRAFT_709828 [Pholiota conissans]|uniref:Uncharacterized protein n=1 Tax=Pholiota conissans TaxID=109636 RepID=A0A9P6CU35_9AGAR|nr:hypothetical protein BDN70DRAFT_709828 [Pholiota conissans]
MSEKKAPEFIELTLTIHYHGDKASEFSSNSTNVSAALAQATKFAILEADLDALSFPRPKRKKVKWLPLGRIKCVWSKIEKHSVFHKHVRKRVDPPDESRGS